MTLTIKIDMDNAAFEDNGRRRETRRILQQAADMFSLNDRNRGVPVSLLDSNGNTVGYAEVTDD